MKRGGASHPGWLGLCRAAQRRGRRSRVPDHPPTSVHLMDPQLLKGTHLLLTVSAPVCTINDLLPYISAPPRAQ